MSKKQTEDTRVKAVKVARGMTLRMQSDLLNWHNEWPDLRRQDLLSARGLLTETTSMFTKPDLTPLGKLVLAILQAKGPLPELPQARRNQILAAEREVLRCAKEWRRLHCGAAGSFKPLQDAIDELLVLEEKA